MVKIVKGIETDKWFPQYMRTCTFPICRQPAEKSADIAGSAFLLLYEKKPYIVTASHVIDIENPVVVLSKKDRQIVSVSSSYFQQAGLKWIKHPGGLDLAAIPFYLPFSLANELELWPVPEDQWKFKTIKVGDEILHLGYPEKGTSRFTDGKPCIFPQAMPGKIISIENECIVMETAGAHGASGGPVFLKRKNANPHIIGVVVTARKYRKSTRSTKTTYLNRTKALHVSLVKDILDLEEMQKQSSNISYFN
jgi:hypothetical protein